MIDRIRYAAVLVLDECRYVPRQFGTHTAHELKEVIDPTGPAVTDPEGFAEAGEEYLRAAAALLKLLKKRSATVYVTAPGAEGRGMP